MRFYAATFATVFMELEMLQRDALCDPDETPPAEGAWRTTAARRLIIMADECNRVGFDRLRERCKRLAQNVKTIDVLVACHMLRDLLPDIQSEMARHMYFFVPEHRKCWYHDDNQPLFGAAVADAFPDASPEIGEAGRCYALAPVDRLCIPSNARARNRAAYVGERTWRRSVLSDRT